MNTKRPLPQIAIAAMLGLSAVLSALEPAAPIIKIEPSVEVPKPFPGFDEAHGEGMVGWSFQLLIPFTVTHVGWYDQEKDGLSRAFQVGLWQSDPGLPPFSGWSSASMIGDPAKGLTIPAATNATLLGVWRVVALAQPLMLAPGFYQLGGLDSSGTADVIKYVQASPGPTTLTPRGSTVSIGSFFYAAVGTKTNFGPATNFYAAWGLELGPMLFGSNPSPPPMGSELKINRILATPPSANPSWVLLTWPAGTLQEAEAAGGPYTPVPELREQYLVVPSPAPPQKFYRVRP